MWISSPTYFKINTDEVLDISCVNVIFYDCKIIEVHFIEAARCGAVVNINELSYFEQSDFKRLDMFWFCGLYKLSKYLATRCRAIVNINKSLV